MLLAELHFPLTLVIWPMALIFAVLIGFVFWVRRHSAKSIEFIDRRTTIQVICIGLLFLTLFGMTGYRDIVRTNDPPARSWSLNGPLGSYGILEWKFFWITNLFSEPVEEWQTDILLGPLRLAFEGRAPSALGSFLCLSAIAGWMGILTFKVSRGHILQRGAA